MFPLTTRIRLTGIISAVKHFVLSGIKAENGNGLECAGTQGRLNYLTRRRRMRELLRLLFPLEQKGIG